MHSNDKASSVRGQNIRIEPGQKIHIEFKRTEYADLSKPYTEKECLKPEEIKTTQSEKHTFENVFSVKVCEEKCYRERFPMFCGCELSSDDIGRECSIYDFFNCRFNYYLYQKCKEDCKEPCEYVKYSATYSVTPYDTSANSRNTEEVNKRLISISLQPETLDTTYITQRPRYQFFDIFSNIGGLMGLCLGISLITLLEVFEFFFSSLISECKKLFNHIQTCRQT